MTESDIRLAAAWDLSLCLSCEASFDASATDTCPSCGSDESVEAWKVLKVLNLLSDDE